MYHCSKYRMVFQNRRKSLDQQRRELSLHFERIKFIKSAKNDDFLKNVKSVTRQVNSSWTKIGGKCQN